jgi:DNA-binding HxlR family transcriptional regulator
MADFQLCPKYECAFEILGKKWTGLIIKVLLEGPRRFSDISTLIPNVSDKMLGERFRELESLGIVSRKVYPEIPVRVEYELTEKGKAFKLALDEVQKWAEAWIE